MLLRPEDDTPNEITSRYSGGLRAAAPTYIQPIYPTDSDTVARPGYPAPTATVAPTGLPMTAAPGCGSGCGVGGTGGQGTGSGLNLPSFDGANPGQSFAPGGSTSTVSKASEMCTEAEKRFDWIKLAAAFAVGYFVAKS